MAMLSNARKNLIKETALKDGEIVISEIARELDVSLETVRRDINTLCAEGVLEKVHGGAVPVNTNSYEDEYAKRKTTNEAVKRELGSFVADMLKNAKTVFLSSGTTTEAIAGFKAKFPDTAVITNSLAVAETIAKSGDKNQTTLLLGGNINAQEHITYGAEVVSGVEKYHADIAVISGVGIDESGAMCASTDEGTVMTAMIKSSSKVIFVADSGKFGKKSVYRHCKLENISTVVTDSKNKIPEKILKSFNANKVKITVI